MGLGKNQVERLFRPITYVDLDLLIPIPRCPPPHPSSSSSTTSLSALCGHLLPPAHSVKRELIDDEEEKTKAILC